MWTLGATILRVMPWPRTQTPATTMPLENHRAASTGLRCGDLPGVREHLGACVLRRAPQRGPAGAAPWGTQGGGPMYSKADPGLESSLGGCQKSPGVNDYRRAGRAATLGGADTEETGCGPQVGHLGRTRGVRGWPRWGYTAPGSHTATSGEHGGATTTPTGGLDEETDCC